MSHDAHVKVLIGPARSGKAARTRELYLRLVSETDPARVLLLVPTGRRRVATLEALVRDTPTRTLWQPRVETFPRCAENLLRRSGARVRRITPLQRQGLLAEAMRSCRGDGQLSYLEAILDRPGLLESLAGFIHRLKTGEVLPEAFSEAAHQSKAPGLIDAANVYRRYQEKLGRLDLYDDAGLFWQTNRAIERRGAGSDEVPWPEYVIADGFQDFSPPQVGLLRAFQRHGAPLTITLPCDPDRPEVFEPALRVLERLREAFGPSLSVERVSPETSAPSGHLRNLEKGLFDDSADGTGSDNTGTVTFIEAAGRRREAEALARRVKAWLRDGNRSPGDVAVVLRATGAYAEQIAEVFPRYGLPVAQRPPWSLGNLPLPAWLLALLRLQRDDYPYADLAAVLRSPYFPAERFGVGEADLESADRLLHQGEVFSGLEEHLEALQQVRRIEAQRDSDESEQETQSPVTPERIGNVEALLRALDERLDAFPPRAALAGYADGVTALLDEFGLEERATQGTDLELIARDLASVERLRELLDEMKTLDQWTDHGSLSWAEFLADFERGVRSAEVPPPAPLGRAVQVLDVRSSRALSFPLVVIPALNQGTWPQPRPQRLLERPEKKPGLENAGLRVSSHQEHLAEERFLFYVAVTRASDHLIVSRQAADEDGRPQLASPFWEELGRLTAKGGRPPVETVSVRDTDLPGEQAVSLEEVRRAAFLALAGDAKQAARLLLALREMGDPGVTAGLRAVAVEHERESERPFGPFDGVLRSGEALAALKDRFPGGHVFSASRLEDYCLCPFRFFAVTVLGLRPWELPREDFQDTQVGLLYHRILRDFYRRMQNHPEGTRLERISAETLNEEMKAAIAAALAREKRATEGRLPGLWEIQRVEITDRLLAYVRDEADRCRQADVDIEPRLFEWAFGGTPRPGDDPESATDPLTISSDDGPIRIQGRVDRVDVIRPQGASPKLAIVDYKSGGKAGSLADDFVEGRRLQLPLYLLAVEALLSEKLGAEAAQGIHYYLREPKAHADLDLLSPKHAGKYQLALEACRKRVRDIVSGARRALFPPVPDKQCPHWCEYRDLCRSVRWRVERKTDEDDARELYD